MMSLNVYYEKTKNLKNIIFIDDWGWFIDLESNYYDFELSNKTYKPKIQYKLYILPTINEISNIKSIKSMQNLHELDFKEKNIKNIKNIKNNVVQINIKWIVKSICILGIIGVFYKCYFMKVIKMLVGG